MRHPSSPSPHSRTRRPSTLGARAEAHSWAPNTRKAYVADWNDFTNWCIENRCPGLPVVPDDVGRYLEHLVETQGKSLAAAAHRLDGYPDPTSLPLVKATLRLLAREHGKGCRQAKGLAFEALAAMKAKARIQRIHQGNRRRNETEGKAARRALVDLN